MSRLTQNILANFVGNVWTGLMLLAFIPLYIHFMGIEAYGLVGIYATIQAMFALLDLGMSTTLSREMARLAVHRDNARDMRHLVRTFETITLGMAVVIALVMFALAPLIAFHWVDVRQLAPTTVRQAIQLMGLAMACQWPFGLYSGGLLGLQRQVLLNVLVVVAATFRGVGAILILWKISPTIQAYFCWQVVSGVLQTVLVAWWLWRSLPHAPGKASFQLELLRGTWRFAAGMSGITVLAVILTQLDKVILSRLLTLEMFGYYSVASVVALSLYRLIGPVFAALYPRFTELVALGDDAGMRRLYHSSCQFMSVLVLPVAIILALFSRELLTLWTQNPAMADHTHWLLTLLVVGTALNGLMNLPYAVQLAHGWTQLALAVNGVSVLVLVPLLLVLTSYYGAVGAALVWTLLNSGYVLVAIQIMHTRLLPKEKWRWYREDVGFPLVVSLSVAGTCRWLFPHAPSQVATILWLLIAASLTLMTTVVATPVTRSALVSNITRLWESHGN